MTGYRIEVRYADEDMLAALIAMYDLTMYEAIGRLAGMSTKQREDEMEKFYFGHPDDPAED